MWVTVYVNWALAKVSEVDKTILAFDASFIPSDLYYIMSPCWLVLCYCSGKL